MSGPEPSAVTEAVAAVASRIRVAGGTVDDSSGHRERPGGVRIVAVTKGFAASAVTAATEAGLDVCGENYAQELLAKSQDLHRGGHRQPRWHMIGRLQRNKVRMLAGLVELWQSVDRASLGAEIARRDPGARVLVQCDLFGAPTQGGAPLDEVPALVEELSAAGLHVEGLMGIGALGEPEDSRRGFAGLVALADRLGLAERSIGMSGDLEVAVSEGSTMVRVGTALFGERTIPRVADH